MKLGLYGYGKMGQTVERIALSKGDEVVWKVGSRSSEELKEDQIRDADVVIEFSQPDAAYKNIQKCLNAGVRVITGTTGWLKDMAAVETLTKQQNLAFLQASNFSVGVNLFFAVNAYLSRLMADQPEYSPLITETHHIQKKDSPSGTAISLAEAIIDASNGTLTNWSLDGSVDVKHNTIPIHSHRLDDVPGTHTMTWAGSVDEIQLIHEAKSRDGFGYGAWLAAHWIAEKHGVFTMADVLGFHSSADKS